MYHVGYFECEVTGKSAPPADALDPLDFQEGERLPVGWASVTIQRHIENTEHARETAARKSIVEQHVAEALKEVEGADAAIAEQIRAAVELQVPEVEGEPFILTDEVFHYSPKHADALLAALPGVGDPE